MLKTVICVLALGVATPAHATTPNVGDMSATEAGVDGCPGILFARAGFGKTVKAPYVFAIVEDRATFRIDGQIIALTRFASMDEETKVGAMVGGAYSSSASPYSAALVARVTQIVTNPESDSIVYYTGTLTVRAGDDKQVINVKGVSGC